MQLTIPCFIFKKQKKKRIAKGLRLFFSIAKATGDPFFFARPPFRPGSFLMSIAHFGNKEIEKENKTEPPKIDVETRERDKTSSL